MTGKIDVVKAFHKEAYANMPSSIMEANKKYLSDDFKNFDTDGSVLMDKAAYLAMAQKLVSAFNDLQWVVSDMHEEGDGVVVKVSFRRHADGRYRLLGDGPGRCPGQWEKDCVAGIQR